MDEVPEVQGYLADKKLPHPPKPQNQNQVWIPNLNHIGLWIDDLEVSSPPILGGSGLLEPSYLLLYYSQA